MQRCFRLLFDTAFFLFGIHGLIQGLQLFFEDLDRMPFAQQRRIAFGAQSIVVFLYLSQGLVVGLSLRREKFQNVENLNSATL